MPDSIAKYFNANERPPVGGWHYFYDSQNRSTYFKAGSAEEVMQILAKYRKNNGTFVSAVDIEREVWVYWCSLDPVRCGQSQGSEIRENGPLQPRDVPKEVWGPILWKFLNHAAVHYSHGWFEGVIREMASRLITCPDCRQEFFRLLEKYPISAVRDQKSACLWVNTVHNAVNARIGKAQYPYERAVREYGFPLQS